MNAIPAQSRKIRVAIVEDKKDIRESIGDLLNDTPGMECNCRCASGEEAITKLPSADVDIALLDINLPGMNGVEVLLRVRLTCPNTEFMMFTVFEDDNHVFDALQAGATGYITKKTPSPKIIDAIQELYAGGSPMSPTIARKLLDRMKTAAPGAPIQEEMTKLKKNEIDLLELLAKGLLYKEIGRALALTEGTVKQYINRIYKKMEVQNRTEAVNKYLGRYN